MFCIFGFAFETETGGICIAPRPSDPDAEIVPGMAMRPFFGIKPVLINSEVQSSSLYCNLCGTQPFTSRLDGNGPDRGSD